MASAELLELVENSRTNRGEVVQRWAWKVLLISWLEDLQKRKIYNYGLIENKTVFLMSMYLYPVLSFRAKAETLKPRGNWFSRFLSS